MSCNNGKNLNILYVDDEPNYCRLFSRLLADKDEYTVHTAESGTEALEIISDHKIDVVFTDLLMPNMNGIELVERIKNINPDIFIIVLTGLDSAIEAVKAIKAGAYDYILKRLDSEMIEKCLENVSEYMQKSAELKREGDIGFGKLVGRSKPMLQMYEQINKVADTDAAVLICGESGTGKELIAEEIHARSSRKNNTFIKANLAALSEGLINSTLFGYEKGAFTGASSRKKGLFEAASGGTIFLDEIGDIPAQTQVALLRILEQQSFQRVGGTEDVNIDVRVICATNKNLEAEVRNKKFREDLFYRINVVSVTAPSLRERQSDIPLLSEYFLQKYCFDSGKNIELIEPSTIKALCRYSWPGNIRELSNTIKHAVIFCNSRTIGLSHLPESVVSDKNSSFSVTLSRSSLESAEETLIRSVLEQTGWNLSKTAEALNIARGTLYSKLKKLDIKRTPDKS